MIWFIGDAFLHKNFNGLQALKTEAKLKKDKLPYLYEFYNLSAWFCSQVKTNVPVIAKLQNSLAAALNEYEHLPKYIVIIPDMDIVQDVNLFQCGVKDALYDNINWLFKQVGKCLITRHEDLMDKNLGSVSQDKTRILWVPMLTRPITEDPELAKLWKLCRKYNEILEHHLEVENFMHLIKLPHMEEFSYFDQFGNLTTNGQHSFWKSMNKLKIWTMICPKMLKRIRVLDYTIENCLLPHQFDQKCLAVSADLMLHLNTTVNRFNPTANIVLVLHVTTCFYAMVEIYVIFCHILT